MAKSGVSTYEVEEDAASGAPPAAVGEHHAPGRLDLLSSCEEGAPSLRAEPADDAADLTERAALRLAELGGDLLGGPPLFRSQAWAGGADWLRTRRRVGLPIATGGGRGLLLPICYV